MLYKINSNQIATDQTQHPHTLNHASQTCSTSYPYIPDSTDTYKIPPAIIPIREWNNLPPDIVSVQVS